MLIGIGLRKDNPSVEAAWKTATSSNPDFSSFSGDKKSPWPFFVFVGLVIGAPWLMFKLLARNVSKKPFGNLLVSLHNLSLYSKLPIIRGIVLKNYIW